MEDTVNATVVVGDIINATVDNTAETVTVTLTNEQEVLNATINSGARGEKGEKGEDGVTPVKGIDYFDGVDGVDGVNPLTVSATEPLNPQIGDLWYQP